MDHKNGFNIEKSIYFKYKRSIEIKNKNQLLKGLVKITWFLFFT